MSDYVSLEIKCPCGHILKKVLNNPKVAPTTSTTKCPACKRTVKYTYGRGTYSAEYK